MPYATQRLSPLKPALTYSDFGSVMMALKNLVYTGLHSALHNTQTHGWREEAEQADIGAVCLRCASDGFLIGANIIGFLIL